MIMIPPIYDRTTNIGEKKVFLKLKDDPNPLTKNWVVYHSLNYPVSVKKKIENPINILERQIL